jgi:hypothetical protein
MKTESDYDRHRQQPLSKRDNNYDQRRTELLGDGERYQWLGAVLFGAGASVATASAVYWFVTAETPATTAVVQPQPGGATFAVRSRF